MARVTWTVEYKQIGRGEYQRVRHLVQPDAGRTLCGRELGEMTTRLPTRLYRHQKISSAWGERCEQCASLAGEALPLLPPA